MSWQETPYVDWDPQGFASGQLWRGVAEGERFEWSGSGSADPPDTTYEIVVKEDVGLYLWRNSMPWGHSGEWVVSEGPYWCVHPYYSGHEHADDLNDEYKWFRVARGRIGPRLIIEGRDGLVQATSSSLMVSGHPCWRIDDKLPVYHDPADPENPQSSSYAVAYDMYEGGLCAAYLEDSCEDLRRGEIQQVTYRPAEDLDQLKRFLPRARGRVQWPGGDGYHTAWGAKTSWTDHFNIVDAGLAWHPPFFVDFHRYTWLWNDGSQWLLTRALGAGSAETWRTSGAASKFDRVVLGGSGLSGTHWYDVPSECWLDQVRGSTADGGPLVGASVTLGAFSGSGSGAYPLEWTVSASGDELYAHLYRYEWCGDPFWSSSGMEGRYVSRGILRGICSGEHQGETRDVRWTWDGWLFDTDSPDSRSGWSGELPPPGAYVRTSRTSEVTESGVFETVQETPGDIRYVGCPSWDDEASGEYTRSMSRDVSGNWSYGAVEYDYSAGAWTLPLDDSTLSGAEPSFSGDVQFTDGASSRTLSYAGYRHSWCDVEACMAQAGLWFSAPASGSGSGA